jgi:hypothetical protein
MFENTMTPKSSTAPTGRSTWLVVGALALFALVWWFLPKPKPADTQAPLITAQPLIPITSEQTQTSSASVDTPAPASAASSVPTISTTKILGPSKGSLLANPKPRDVMPDERLHARLNDLDRHLTAQSIEEAEWMDLQGFPTIEEVNSIDPATLDKYNERPNINLRAMALQAAILKRQGNPAWKRQAGSAATLGSILGNRLLIDDLATEKVSLSRDKSIINKVLLGKLLGDSYFPRDAMGDPTLRWSSYKVTSNFEVTLEHFQVYIPYYRAKYGLPPLQPVRRPGRFSAESLENYSRNRE